MHYYIKRETSTDVSNQRATETPIHGKASARGLYEALSVNNNDDVTEDEIGGGNFDEGDKEREHEEDVVNELALRPVEKTSKAKSDDKDVVEKLDDVKGGNVPLVEERVYFWHLGQALQSPFVRYVIYD